MKKKNFLFLIALLLVILGSWLNLGVTVTWGHWAWSSLIGSDGASVVLSAIAHHWGLGVPYKDFWEYRPPGFLFLIDFWVKIFGFKIPSFKLLELVVRFGIGLEIYFLTRKFFSPFRGFVVFCLTSFVFFSPLFGTMMLAEPYGLFFSLMGLLSLVYIRRLGWRFFLAAFFLALASQMKDSFFGAILAVFPLLFYFLFLRDYKSFFKGLVSVSSGYFSLLFLIGFYLFSLGSLEAYRQVWLFKSETFNLHSLLNLDLFFKEYYHFFQSANNPLVRFDYSVGAVLLIWFFISFLSSLMKKQPLSKLIRVKDKIATLTIPSLSFQLTEERLRIISFLFYSLGVFIGFTLNKGLSPHYLIQIIVPIYFLWAMVALSIAGDLEGMFRIFKKDLIFLLLVLFLLFPEDSILFHYRAVPGNFITQAYKNLTLPGGETNLEKYIASKTDRGDCVLSLYGWKSGETYLYSQRRPCSRFFQPNVVNDEWQKKEYRASIFKSPPQAIVYSLEGADMDVLRFEQEVINFPRILDNCYQEDFTQFENPRWSFRLFFPIYSGEELKTCLEQEG